MVEGCVHTIEIDQYSLCHYPCGYVTEGNTDSGESVYGAICTEQITYPADYEAMNLDKQTNDQNVKDSLT
jgi:hypothetical protein